MKKSFTKLFIAAAFIFGFNSASAQAFEEGANVVHLGIGFGSSLYYAGYTKASPPISASLEHGINENIGVGAFVGYASSSFDYLSYYRWNFTYLVIGARGAYHFGDNDKFDPYVGLMLGYNVVSFKQEVLDASYTTTIVSPTYGGITFSGFVGARYLFSDNVGAYLELGYGVAILNLGLALKF